MPKQISAALCRLSTGAAFSLQLHGSPITITLARPILMTVPIGISSAAWKPTSDLLDRMLIVTLPLLTEETTTPESEVAEKFLKARPKILGALAQAVSVAIGQIDQMRLPSYPKHAAAAAWAIAAAPALNISEQSLQQALKQQSEIAISKDSLLQKVARLMATRDDWHGTATNLKLELDFSSAPNHLSRQLKEVQAILLVQGIEITFPPRREYGQLIRIAKLHKNNPTDRPPENPSSDRQSDQNEGDTIPLPPQPDRQTLLPAAATGTATPAESPPGSSNMEAWTSQSAVDLPVGNVDCTYMQGTPTTLAKMDRQIVSAEEPKEKPIKVAVEQHQTESVVLPEQSSNLPLDGRNFLDLDRLEPGVTGPVRASSERGTGVTVELPWTPASDTDDKSESAGAADVTIPP
jgi:hypothetical protein